MDRDARKRKEFERQKFLNQRALAHKEFNAYLTFMSGRVHIKNDRLTSFLYELMRDHITPGKVQEILQDCDEPNVSYSNGWLAEYANFVASFLTDTKLKVGRHGR